MGTMERIRQTSPYILALFAVVFVGFMVASDADVSTLLRQGSDVKTASIGVINGEKLSYLDFEERVKERIEEMRRQQQDPDQEIDEAQIRNDLWNELVEEVLLKQEAKKLGIGVTNEEILDIMIENPPAELRRPLTDSAGNFNRQVYLDLITHPEHYINYIGRDPSQIPEDEKQSLIRTWKKGLLSIEQNIRQQKLYANVSSVVGAAGSVISPTFAKKQYIDDKNSADIQYIYVDAQSVPDAMVKVGDDEIKAYYEKYKQFFKTNEKRRLRYIAFKIEPSHEDSARANNRIQKINEGLATCINDAQKDSVFESKLNEYGGKSEDYMLVKDIDPMKYPLLSSMSIGQVLGPIQMGANQFYFRLDDRRVDKNPVIKASHILINFDNNKDSANAEALKVLEKARKGEDFAELAKEYSQDPGTSRKGGDLGYFAKGQMVKEFNDACFAADSGDIIGPIESKFGYHVIFIEDKKSEEIKYSEIQITTSVSSPTKNAIFRNAFSFQKQVADGADFNSTAQKSNYKVIEMPFFEKARPVLGSQYLTDMAFSSEVGTVFEPKELKFYGVVVAQVAEERSAGIIPFQDMKEEIKERLIKNKKVDACKAKADQIYQLVANSASLESAASLDSNYSVKYDSSFKMSSNIKGKGIDPIFNTNVFNLANGQTQIVKGDLGYYVVRMNNKTMIDENTVTDLEANRFAHTLQSKVRTKLFYDWFKSVKDKAKIEDNRSKYFKEY